MKAADAEHDTGSKKRWLKQHGESGALTTSRSLQVVKPLKLHRNVN